ncbi:MAG: LapA family protein [Gallionellaceae bacterium]|nr:LapA family protein [Gallionellaceae bacterium]
MRYFNWVLRVVLFIILLGFAMKNDQPVVLRYFFGYEWQASLVVVLLVFFAAGIGVGLLTALGKIFMQRREITRLQSKLDQHNKMVVSDE